MKTNQSNKSIRVSRLTAKTRLLSLALMLCLGSSAWAGPLPVDLQSLLSLLKGGFVSAPVQKDPPPRVDGGPVPIPIGPPGVEPVEGQRRIDGSRTGGVRP